MSCPEFSIVRNLTVFLEPSSNIFRSTGGCVAFLVGVRKELSGSLSNLVELSVLSSRLSVLPYKKLLEVMPVSLFKKLAVFPYKKQSVKLSVLPFRKLSVFDIRSLPFMTSLS
jgi:hypothetical protein